MKINNIDGLFNSLKQKHNNYQKNWKQKKSTTLRSYARKQRKSNRPKRWFEPIPCLNETKKLKWVLKGENATLEHYHPHGSNVKGTS
jgi:hypothetical protein